MKAAVLARGGSIWRTWGAADRAQYDFRVAVNCAINEFQAEYLVACDPSTWGFITGRPLIGGYFRGDLAQAGETTPDKMEKFMLFYPHIVDLTGTSPYDFSFSIESAIQVAAMHGAKQIDLYGTLSGAPDENDIHSLGRGLTTNRERWIDEAQRMKRIINHYANEGITIRNIQ